MDRTHWDDSPIIQWIIEWNQELIEILDPAFVKQVQEQALAFDNSIDNREKVQWYLDPYETMEFNNLNPIHKICLQ